MERRDFLTATAAAGAALSSSALGADNAAAAPSGGKFRMKYAPHPGMFRHHAGNDYIDQLKFIADQGFTAWEDNGMMGRDAALQEKAAAAMATLDITMGVFVAFGGFGNKDFVEKSTPAMHDDLKTRMAKVVETAKRVNATWCTVVPGSVSQRLEHDYQMANCIENLRVMAGALEPHGVVMVLEPLNWWANHPGLFLTKIPQAYLICRGVNSPSCKILDDLYHQQVTEGNLIPNIDKAWDEIAYIQIGDNPGRKEPTTGEINYRNVFKHLHDKGYKGVLGMEHGISKGGKEGEAALIEAYRWCDAF